MRLLQLLCAMALLVLPVASSAEDPPVFLTEFGPGVLAYPIGGLGVDAAGNVYVADGGSQNVVKFNNNGQFLGSFGSAGTAAGQFNGPSDVAVAPNGEIYVIDHSNSRVQVFDSHFGFQRMWHPGAFASIAIDPSGQYIVLRVQGYTRVFRPDTSLVAAWPTLYNATCLGIAIGPSGHVYVGITGEVIVYDILGNELTRWPIAAPLALAAAVAVDSDENVYVTTRVPNVQKYTSSGQFLSSFGSVGDGPGQFTEGPMTDIAVDSQRNVFIEQRMGEARIEKYGYAPTPTRPTSWGRLKALYR